MPRFFIEVAYKGTHYSGFQIQENADTIQARIEKVYAMLHRREVVLTGSSRTDAGVHALQNFFHFDAEEVHPQFVYKANAILPHDIVVKNVFRMEDGAHARFDATARAYEYRIHTFKDPFLEELSLYYPFKLDEAKMQEGARLIRGQTNFFAFSKTNTQVKNFYCTIYKSEWRFEGQELVYIIEGNRFLRGMVRLLTATLLKVGRGKVGLDELVQLFANKEKCGHSIAARGLYLKGVQYPPDYFA